MKKIRKIMSILLSGILIFSFAGCLDNSKKDENVSNTPALADASYDKKDGLPPVNDELKKVYKDALALECDLEFANIGLENQEDGSFVSKKVKGMVWYKVKDDRFSTYAELEEYFKSIFTEELAASNMKNYSNSFKDIDGALYTACGGRGSGITYAGHYFTIDSVKSERVLLTAHVYCLDDVATSNPVYEKQSDESRYTMDSIPIEFVKENGVWKLNQFKLLY